jgi:hypothetical protein
MDTLTADMSAASNAQRREMALRRAYQRKLARKPTTLEKMLIARLVKAEIAELDAASTPDFYRANNIATKARAEFKALIAKPEPAPGDDPLRRYLADKYGTKEASA